MALFFFSSRRRHTRSKRDWSSDVCSSDIESGRDKKRAAIYTNGTAEELGAERIVQLICRRWGEENAIKELLHKHLIKYTPGYVREALEEQPLVENSELRERKKQRAGVNK